MSEAQNRTRKAAQQETPTNEGKPAFVRELEEKVEQSRTRRTGRRLELARQRLESGELDAQIPLWPEPLRGLPNSLARSSLFAAKMGDKDRKYIKSSKIASLSNITMTYKGEELFQDDQSVFMGLVHMCRQTPAGAVVEFTAHGLLKELGWGTNSISYQRLRDSITRLTATAINVTMTLGEGKSIGYGGSLIRSFRWRTDSDEPMTKWQVLLEPSIVALFSENSYTLIEWEQRLALGVRSPLTLWMHSFLATHRNPIPLSVEKYLELSSSPIQAMHHFRAKVRASLNRLQKVGFLQEWWIDPKTDLVHVKRNTSHLPPKKTPELLDRRSA